MSVTGTFIWLGGAEASAVTDPNERSGYAVTGAAVAASALVAGGIAAAASAAVQSVAATAAVALAAAAVTAVITRALVSSPGVAPRRLWFAGRVLLALVLGVFLGEAATVVATDAAVDRILDERSRGAAESAPAVIDARAALDRAVADRAALERTIVEAEADTDRALITARCEFNPSAQCPPTRITGVPGDGPEHRTARAMLDEARAQLTAARDRAPGLDRRVTEAERNLTAAYSAAEQTGDRGPAARWTAMHAHTTSSATALLPRLAALLAALLIALLPLLARRWLGVTSLDRHTAARAVMDEAERAAEKSIAVQRARLRAATAELRAGQELDAVRRVTAAPAAARLPELGTADRPALGAPRRPVLGRAVPPVQAAAPVRAAIPSRAPLTIDAEAAAAMPSSLAAEEESGLGESPRTVAGPAVGTRRTRILATIGGLEIGVTEPVRPVRAATETGSGLGSPVTMDDHTTAAPPAGLSPAQRVASLPVLGNLPFAGRLGPLIPPFVLDVLDDATRPLRTARQALEQVEELTFTLRQSRMISVAVREIATEAEPRSKRVVTATVVDVKPVPRDSCARSTGTRFH